MSDINDGGPAFPWGEHGTHLGGMTLRDYFAAKAMQGLVTATQEMTHVTVAMLADEAYAYADAMLAARSKA